MVFQEVELENYFPYKKEPRYTFISKDIYRSLFGRPSAKINIKIAKD